MTTLIVQFGLALGYAGLTVGNVHLWGAAIRNAVRQIVLMSCGAARVSAAGPVSGNGLNLCIQLAPYANADVIASDHTQTYHTSGWDGPIDMGRWEGTVWRFTPKGKMLLVQDERSEDPWCY